MSFCNAVGAEMHFSSLFICCQNPEGN